VSGRVLPVILLLLLGAPAGAEDVVGPQVCRACHAGAYEVWKASPHARAEIELGERAGDPQCLSCHAPQKSDGLSGVSCEGCHGGGQHYSPVYVMRDSELARLAGLKATDEKSCRSCHDDAMTPSLRRFDHASMLSRIDHWTADREARKAPRAAK
jgi:hypothetical protein